MPDLSRILAAQSPLTLASLPRGGLPLVLADLARAAKRRAVFIAPDDAAMRAAVEAAQFFAPEINVFAFPAWDCLPYDRASPALSISAERLAALCLPRSACVKACASSRSAPISATPAWRRC
jgi:transcription-repair coupling factor (superfamily II helicase)